MASHKGRLCTAKPLRWLGLPRNAICILEQLCYTIHAQNLTSHLNKRSFSGHIGFWCHQKTAEIAEITEIPPYFSYLRLYTQSRPRTLTKEFLHSISHPALSKNDVNSVKTPGRFVTSCPLCPRSRVLGIARELATGQSLFTITERSLRLR